MNPTDQIVKWGVTEIIDTRAQVFVVAKMGFTLIQREASPFLELP